uniref:Uncharacterized protein n=1 Tax=Vitis vinifera TaxID=29760 RepID=F6HF33_VITVI
MAIISFAYMEGERNFFTWMLGWATERVQCHCLRQGWGSIMGMVKLFS